MKYLILILFVLLVACATQMPDEPSNCIQTKDGLQCEAGDSDILPKIIDHDPEFSTEEVRDGR